MYMSPDDDVTTAAGPLKMPEGDTPAKVVIMPDDKICSNIQHCFIT
jgi:hypothetical protein